MEMPKPICFMIMPYGRKATQAEAGRGVPEIDFNALWDRAFAPTIIALGYEPVRADQDTGALIITQMLERLYFADLVLADMTIPNGNVYYEIGIRHAARERGCVLLAADWSKALFDVAQMRTVRYPMPEGDITAATAQAIAAAIKDPIGQLARGVSPMRESIRGYPDNVDEAAASSMKDTMLELAAFQGEVRAVRAVPRTGRMERAKQLLAKYWMPPVTAPTAIGLLLLMKDSAETGDDWTWVTDFIGRLPGDLADLEEVRELDAFAVSNAGKPVDAIAKLEALVLTSGPTPERLGLLGGRYKRLYAKAATTSEKLLYLHKSIDAYERGMELDLNEYYCSSNLPRLYRARMRKGDAEKAQAVSQIVIAACKRAKSRGLADEWLRPTLLGAAFDAGDCDEAEELAVEVAAEGAARWKLDSILSALRTSLAQVQDEACKERLTSVLDGLEQAGV
jgi:tetratricopeptide (TPR) repeat protein